jgi:alpha-D-xyloside xylohydrolase
MGVEIGKFSCLGNRAGDMAAVVVGVSLVLVAGLTINAAPLSSLKQLSKDSVVMNGEDGEVRVTAVSDGILRVTYTRAKQFRPDDSIMVLKQTPTGVLESQDIGAAYNLSTKEIKVVVDKKTGGLVFSHAGKVFANFPKVELAATDLTRYVPQEGKIVKTGDGCSAKLFFDFGGDEAIYGFGQHEEGYLNYRGKKQYIYQHNLKVAMPVFLSSAGYGVLFDTYAYSIFDDTQKPPFFWTEAVDEFDFYVIYGPDFDKVIAGVRRLTGRSTLFPKWTFGYIQSKERYRSQKELVQIVDEYRKRNIPLDCIVQDWRYWPRGWGGKRFKPAAFPDMTEGIKQIHDRHVKFMISIWPLVKGCEDAKELSAAGCMLGMGNYNPFLEKARKLYWKQAHDGLFVHGVDAWWCDCTEPVDTDWGTKKFIPVDVRAKNNTGRLRELIGNEYLNAFSLQHSKGIFENQLKTAPDMRVVNLTRSAYPGQQRYGAITWSGDTKADWDVIEKEIAEGLSFCASGDPKWTLDTGAFFVGSRTSFYFRKSKGFDRGCNNPGYRELYTRWLQFSTFLPMLRSHGTSTPREVWRFGKPGEMFYDTLLKFIDFRYRMLPYIYSVAAAETFKDYTMMRLLAFDFRTDAKALNVKNEFMFGPAFLVAPVTTPFYYDPQGKQISSSEKSKTVYLPKCAGWYDFWTGKKYEGGRDVSVDAPISIVPLFVKAGSIVPLGPVEQYADEKKDAPWELRVYPGTDGEFTVYEDDGISTAYKKGERSSYTISWDDKNRILEFSAREGRFPGMCGKRSLGIVIVAPGHGVGDDVESKPDKTVVYTGESMRVAF